MVILHVSDLHLRYFNWVSERAQDVDLVVISGDLQDAFAATPMHDQARRVAGWLLSLRTPTVVCSGNHDWWVQHPRQVDPAAEGRWLSSLAGQGSIIATDGDVIERDGQAIAVNGWLSQPKTECTLLVSHAPPAGCPCSVSKEDLSVIGDDTLLDALPSAPELILCGHVHHPLALACRWTPVNPKTVVLNTGCDLKAAAPQHWVIDTSRRSAGHSLGAHVRW